jgi:hypothetical protein
MDQYNSNPGGSANMPPFGTEPPALDTAADHQLPAAGETGEALGDTLRGSTGTMGGLSTESDRLSTDTETRSGGARTRLENLGDQLEDSVNQRMQSTADRMDDAAEQLDRFTDERTRGATGIRAQAGSMAHSVADMLESTASYLRDNDVGSLRSDLGRQMRERPLQTLLVGVAAGWVVGKILR